MTTPTAPLLSIALTPALQEVLFFERFDMGAVNRASQRKWSAAGKGVNVATALARLGEQVRVTAKKRDDLQAVIAACKDHDFEIPLQFGNFRD